MKRFIEITANTEDEAKKLAERELRPNETITGREVLAAPPRGIFGVVGNPEIRIRFAIEPKVSAAEAPREPVAAKSQSPDSDYSENDSNDFLDAEEETDDSSEHVAESDSYDFVDAETDVAPGHTGKQAPLGAEHPMHDLVHKIVRQVAEFVGVTDINLADRVSGGVWILDVMGSNLSQLIGKHGRTLDAVQYLVNIIANRGGEGYAKLMVDVEGYREKRHKSLVQLANRMYRKVLDSGRQVELEPMSTLDRRTIHLALKDRAGVETFSKGTEPMRRVVIAPTNKAAKEQPPLRRSRGGYRGNRGQPKRNTNTSEEMQNGPKSTSVPMFMEDFSDED